MVGNVEDGQMFIKNAFEERETWIVSHDQQTQSRGNLDTSGIFTVMLHIFFGPLMTNLKLIGNQCMYICICKTKSAVCECVRSDLSCIIDNSYFNSHLKTSM